MKRPSSGCRQVRQVSLAWQKKLLAIHPTQWQAEMLVAVRHELIRASRLPAYRHIPRKQFHMAQRAKSLEELARFIPISDKKSLFAGRDLTDLFPASLCRQIGLVYTSSGFTGNFSWAFEPKNQEQVVTELDVMLDVQFGIARTPTLLVNALPTGVRVDTRMCMLIETGPRADSVVAALRMLRKAVNQTILVGDWPLLKAALEEAVDQRAFQTAIGPVHIITGGDWIAENWRSYVTNLLSGVCPGLAGACLINFGVSELGLSVGQETLACVKVRKVAHENQEFRRTLFGDWPVVPTLVQYQPWRYWMETVEREGRDQLVVTTLDPQRMLPMIRYCTGDHARVWTYAQWCSLLEHAGYSHLKPTEPLPVLAIYGRGAKPSTKMHPAIPLVIREAIFSQAALARNLTGHFVMRNTPQGIELNLQLKKGVDPTQSNIKQLYELEQNLTPICGQVRCQFTTYGNYLPGMEINYLRKFGHELSDRMER